MKPFQISLVVIYLCLLANASGLALGNDNNNRDANDHNRNNKMKSSSGSSGNNSKSNNKDDNVAVVMAVPAAEAAKNVINVSERVPNEQNGVNIIRLESPMTTTTTTTTTVAATTKSNKIGDARVNDDGRRQMQQQQHQHLNRKEDESRVSGAQKQVDDVQQVESSASELSRFNYIATPSPWTTEASVDGDSKASRRWAKLMSGFNRRYQPVERNNEDDAEKEDGDDGETRTPEVEEANYSNNQSEQQAVNPFLTFLNVISSIWSSVTSDEERQAANGAEQMRQDGTESLIVEPRHQKPDNQTAAVNSNSTEVVEGRYIKGDPLNGYYDFVITEGSYKFWVVFQLATAVLIIYATFAAIYYSKVNPIVSDYDYQDYLGGGRSMGDADVIDDDDDSDNGMAKQASWFPSGDWMNKVKYATQFVLDAVEKRPQSGY